MRRRPKALAKPLQDELAQPLTVGEQEIAISVSVAAIMLPTEADTAERALQIAGMVMTPRQGGRPGGAALLRARHGRAAAGAQGARARPGQGDREPRVRGLLPAQDERAHARAVRRRGADPLAPPAARADRAGPVHPGRRGDADDHRRSAAGCWSRPAATRRSWGGVQVAVNLSPAQFTDDDLLGDGGERDPSARGCRRPSSRSRSPRACCWPTMPAPTR